MGTPTEPPRCLGVVLAGGLSSRMGRDKALLSWRGRPLIEHQLEVLREAGVDEARVSGMRPDYQGVADATPQAGPLGGLAGIAQAVIGDADLLVIPVDMPLLQANLLQRLRSEQPQASSVSFAGHVLPLRLRLNTRSREALAELMSRGDPRRRSLRALQSALGHVELALGAGEAAQLADCNTETQWNEVAG
ncbi:molybdenum cofactor guanylyltransferase [Dyella sp. SG609]|uniref:molybdenum cofactor guanylyltransferase n=1 Tax=Dyella sp. SG609 TaxID=2587018 RepID=UPI001444B3FB|nr:molybdenum cofactor guanylyltransferase [Dyella sp. SG609]NKJ22397.1 molybdopterin-guanine dinucleotide biosynthesis protein A [Dyella sp. SG609]